MEYYELSHGHTKSIYFKEEICMTNIFDQENTLPEELDIYVSRILAKYYNEEQILFSETADIKAPVEMCFYKKIDGTGLTTTSYGVKCLKEVKVCNWDTSEKIICNHKARLKVRFKIFVCAQYEDDSYGVTMLPEDAGVNFCFTTLFPATIGYNESLSVVDDYFVWEKDIPFTDFNEPIPPCVFDDPTLQTHLIVKGIRPEYDVRNDCQCPGPGATLIQGTQVLLSIYAELLDKLGVEQDILITGIPLKC